MQQNSLPAEKRIKPCVVITLSYVFGYSIREILEADGGRTTWKGVLPERLTVSQIVNNFPTFSGEEMFISKLQPARCNVSLFYVYGSMHHNIFYEITNRCSYMQSILFHC